MTLYGGKSPETCGEGHPGSAGASSHKFGLGSGLTLVLHLTTECHQAVTYGG